MKPLYLSLMGINSFTDKQEIFFDRLTEGRLFCIYGTTGSGKTTILDSIVLALYGKGGRGKIADYINLSLDSAAVELEFEADEIAYRVERKFFRDANKPSKCILTDKTNSKILADTVSAADVRLKEIIGLAANEFTQVALIEQGKFGEFLAADKAARNASVGSLFRLDKFKHLYGKFSGKLAILAERAANLDKQLEECGEVSEESISAGLEHIEQLKITQKNLLVTLGECSGEIEKQRGLKLEWDNAVKARERQAELEKCQTEITAEISALEDKLRRIDEYKSEAETKKITVERDRHLYFELEGLKNTFLQKKKAEERQKQLVILIEENKASNKKNLQKQKIHRAKMLELAKNASVDFALASKIYKMDITEIKQSLQEIAAQKNTSYQKGKIRIFVGELGQKVASLILERERITKEIETSRKLLAAIENEKENERNIHAESLKESNRLKTKIEDRQKEIGALKEEIRAAQIKDAAQNIRENLREGEQCPVCGGRVGERNKYDGMSKTKQKEERLFAAEQELDSLRSRLSKVENTIAVIATKSDERERQAERYSQTIAEAEQSLKKIETNVLELEKLDELPKILDNLATTIESLDYSFEETSMLEQGQNSLLEKEKSLAEELADRETSIGQMAAAIDAKTKGEDLFLVQAAIEKRIKDDSDFVTRFEKGREETEIAIREKNNKKAGLLGEIKNIKEISQKKVDFDAAAFAALEEKRVKLDGERMAAERELITAELAAKSARQSLDKKVKITEQIKQNTEKCDRISVILKLLKGDRFLEYVAEEYILRFTAVASNTLAKISSGKYTMEYIDGVFYVRDFLMSGELRKASTLSGGETFLASLSLAMAITEEISQFKSFEFFFLDEGFGTLDAGSIDIVYDALETLSKETLVGIVTHRGELVDKIQTRLNVTAATEGTGSKITHVF